MARLIAEIADSAGQKRQGPFVAGGKLDTTLAQLAPQVVKKFPFALLDHGPRQPMAIDVEIASNFDPRRGRPAGT